MVKRRTFKKSLKTAVKKAISRYYRVTVNRPITLTTTAQNEVLLAGLQEAYDLSHILTGTSTFQELGKQFALVKLRGVYVQVNPCHMGSAYGMVSLALQQANEANNTGVWSQPNLISCSEQEITKRYIPIDSSWEPTNALSTIANLKLAYQVLQNFNFYYKVVFTHLKHQGTPTPQLLRRSKST